MLITWSGSQVPQLRLQLESMTTAGLPRAGAAQVGPCRAKLIQLRNAAIYYHCGKIRTLAEPPQATRPDICWFSSPATSIQTLLVISDRLAMRT